MTKKRKRRKLRQFLLVLAVEGAILAVAFLIYFPGRQTPMALTLATGIGVSRLQAHVDRLEQKAIEGVDLTDADRRFLKNLYTCFAKGARLTIVLRQSSQMMRRYLSKSGEDLRTASRIFVKSRPVQEQMQALREQILRDLKQTGQITELYSSETFYMGDPEFLDSACGLYFGHITVRPETTAKGTVRLEWRAEVPWEWPSYESLYKKYGDYHAQSFPLPNVRGWLQGPEYCLRIDDGLGGHLAEIGLAKPFLVYSEWSEEIDAAQLPHGPSPDGERESGADDAADGSTSPPRARP
jgi:hypothetical protein